MRAGADLYVIGSGIARLEARAMAACIPLQAQLELTGRCHLDCAHCYLDIKRPPKDELSTGEVVRVLGELAAAGSMFLTVTGGEIFLRDDILDILAAAKQRRFAVRLFTSGTLLDRKLVGKIAALQPANVEISIYGMHSGLHDAVTRRPGSLRKSLRAALLLRRAGVPVVIKSPMLTGTGESHFDLIDAARRIGAGWRIDPGLMSRRDGGEEPLGLRPSIDEVARFYADPRMGGATGPLPGPPAPDEAPCAIARRVVRIAPNGDVYACTAFPIPAGNLREQSFADIWHHSSVLQEIRSFTAGDVQGACTGCSRQGYCGRCSAQALLEHGDFRGPTVAACDRAQAREQAAGVTPPPGARRIADGTPLGRREVSDFVPVSALALRNRPSKHGLTAAVRGSFA